MQLHPCSMGVKSLAVEAWRKLIVPVDVIAFPKRCTRIMISFNKDNIGSFTKEKKSSYCCS